MTSNGADDLFGRLFELFNQPGPVNWALALEVAKHVVGEKEPVEPWAVEELRELARLAEWRVDELAELSAPPSPDVLPLDPREWTERNIESFDYMAEPFAGSFTAKQEETGSMEAMLAPLGPALIGMQMGASIGALAQSAIATFDIGLPAPPDLPLMLIVSNLQSFAEDVDADERQVRLWAVTYEVAHRAVFARGWVMDHLQDLVRDYADAVNIDVMSLAERLGSIQDPESIQRAIEDEGWEGLVSDEAQPQRQRLEAFLAMTSGETRRAVRRASGELLPELDSLNTARDARKADSSQSVSGLPSIIPDASGGSQGEEFLEELDRRYGEGSSAKVWGDPDQLPTWSELADPVGWAARVLLDDIG